jgi:hypothetical protein
MTPKRVTIIPDIHGKITRDGKVSEPDKTNGLQHSGIRPASRSDLISRAAGCTYRPPVR